MISRSDCDKLKAMYYFLQVNVNESRNTTSKLQNGVSNTSFLILRHVGRVYLIYTK